VVGASPASWPVASGQEFDIPTQDPYDRWKHLTINTHADAAAAVVAFLSPI
jgi:hypothetical protein